MGVTCFESAFPPLGIGDIPQASPWGVTVSHHKQMTNGGLLRAQSEEWTKPALSLMCRSTLLALLAVATAAQAQDLHLKKNVSTGGYVVSTTETSIKGARERSVTQTQNGSTVTLHQCDLRRTLTMNEANQTYYVADDAQDENAAKAAALASGAALPGERTALAVLFLCL